MLTRRDPLKRLNVALLLLAFVLSLFAGRLVQLQGMESGMYAKMALKQGLDRIKLPAVRGDITDAQGYKIAMTVEARTVYADPGVIRDSKIPASKRAEMAQTLSLMLGLNQAQVLKALETPNTKYVVLARKVKPDRARMVMALGYAGINTEAEYQRVYPSGDLAANLIGFVNADGAGGGGLEYSMNKLLAGRNGTRIVEYSPKGQQIPTGQNQVSKPVPGRGVRLTILRDLQWKAQQAIADKVKQTGARNGTVIVMDPRNGQILAMATAPSFDPNNYGAAPSEARRDPAVEEAFEPGSTNKVITAATVMEKGGVTPDTPFLVPDHLRVYDQVLKDAEPHPPMKYTFGGVLAKSSNVGTMMASDKVSADQLYQYMRAFGYGQTSGVKLPGETAGILPTADKWSGTQRYTIAYGQGVGVTALQVASVYSTIANHGVRVAPTLVAGTDDGHGNYTAAPAPEQHRVISEQTAANLVRMLEGVTAEEGTAPQAQIPGYRVAGKTGTAERINPATHTYSGGLYTASFVGFAPADDPQLMVEVVVQEPQGDHYGGTVAAPVFRDVMSFALQTRKIPPTGTKSPTIDIYAR